MIKSRLSRILLSIIGVLILSAPTVWATPLGISISPLKYDISANPGETIKYNVLVTNPNSSVLLVNPEFQDFRIVDDRGENSIQWLPADIDNPHKMIDWIVIDKTPIRLQPKETATVPFEIKIPRNAGVGAHYAAIFFKALFDSPESGIGAVPRVGALILLNVGGEISQTGELLDFTAPLFVNKGPITFSTTLKNTGTAHFKTDVEISIRSILGSKTSITSQEKFIYPGLARTIDTVWDKQWPIGIYFANASVKDGEGVVYEKSRMIIGLPYKYLVALIASLYILFILYKFFKKKFKIVRV